MSKIFLSENQIDLVVKEYVDKARKEQRAVSLFSINALRTYMLENMKDAYLLYPAHTMEDHSHIDVELHNENIDLLKKDMIAFNKTIEQIYNKIKQLDVNFSLLDDYYDNQINIVRNLISNTRANLLSKESSFLEDFSTNDNIDLSKTSAFVDTDTQLVSIDRAEVQDYIDVSAITDETIKTNASSETLSRQYFKGNRTSIFNYVSEEALTIVAITARKENVTAKVVFPLSENKEQKNANRIVVKLINAEGVLARISGANDIGDFIKLHKDEYVKAIKGVFEITHAFGPLRFIQIELVKSKEDYDRGNFYEYNFKIQSVGLHSTNFALSSEIVSKKVQKVVGGTVISPAAVTMEVEDIVPDDTEIDYEVSSDGISWKPIVPLNKGLASNNMISFRTSGSLLIDNIKPLSNQLWSDSRPKQKTGINKLYSLLQFGNTEVNYDFCDFVQDPVIGLDNRIKWEGKSVVADSITVRRGKNDYSAVTSAKPINVKIVDLDFIFRKDLQYSMPIHIQIVDERKQSDFNSIIIPRFPVLTYMPVVVKAGTSEVKVSGLSQSSVTLNNIKNTTVRLTYYTALADYEAVTGNAIVLKEDTIVFKDVVTGSAIAAKNFTINQTDKIVTIRGGSDLSPDNLNEQNISLTLDYEYTIDKNANSTIYQTYVEVNQDTEIIIFPFSIDEVDSYGNFHMIDGADVSFNTNYTLTQGKHQILTTQPHKTDPNNPKDVNLLTKKPCTAGILLDTSALKSMYGFELPQRLVSEFNLANVVKGSDHRSYAAKVHEDGTASIYLNYQPEHIPTSIVQNPTKNHIRGIEVYGKYAVYDPLFNFEEYRTIPETFTITFTTQSMEEQEIDGLYYRAKLNRTEKISTKTPAINKIKLNFIGG